jgi:crossover junction endodeoxyribonuclease RusA
VSDRVKTLDFFVSGAPTPQGSKRAFVVKGKPVLTESAGDRLRIWRQDVRFAAKAAMEQASPDGWEPLTGAVDVTLWFRLRRPKSLPKRVYYPVKRPDLDKLVRAILDALTSVGVFRDDAQVVTLDAFKRFDEKSGVGVTIKEFT